MPIGMENPQERGPFASLLTAQIFFISVTPFVSDEGFGQAFLYLGVFAIMLAGAYVTASSRNLLIVSSGVLVVAIAAWLLPDVLPEKLDELLRLAVVGFGAAFTAVIVLISVRRHERVTTDTLLGGINAYLLIAVAFMMLHASVMVFDPGSYTVLGESLRDSLAGEEDSRGFATMLYFSVTTMTTLGYGDIVPVHPFARLVTSAEAVLGQLFVAVFIARLVSLEVSQRTATK